MLVQKMKSLRGAFKCFSNFLVHFYNHFVIAPFTVRMRISFYGVFVSVRDTFTLACEIRKVWRENNVLQQHHYASTIQGQYNIEINNAMSADSESRFAHLLQPIRYFLLPILVMPMINDT